MCVCLYICVFVFIPYICLCVCIYMYIYAYKPFLSILFPTFCSCTNNSTACSTQRARECAQKCPHYTPGKVGVCLIGIINSRIPSGLISHAAVFCEAHPTWKSPHQHTEQSLQSAGSPRAHSSTGVGRGTLWPRKAAGSPQVHRPRGSSPPLGRCQ